MTAAKLKSDLAGIKPLMERCARQREALNAIGSEVSQINSKLQSARMRFETATANAGRLRTANGARQRVKLDCNDAEIEKADQDIAEAKTVLDQHTVFQENAKGAKEILLAELSDAHEVLSNALEPVLNPVRAVAFEKYQKAVQQVRDALALLQAIGDMSGLGGFELPALAGPHSLSTCGVSGDVAAVIALFSPAVAEQRRSLTTLIRV